MALSVLKILPSQQLSELLSAYRSPNDDLPHAMGHLLYLHAEHNLSFDTIRVLCNEFLNLAEAHGVPPGSEEQVEAAVDLVTTGALEIIYDNIPKEKPILFPQG